MKTVTFNAFAVMPPDGWDDDFVPQYSLCSTPDQAWLRFCHPALNRAAFESDGFRAVPVTVTIKAIEEVTV